MLGAAIDRKERKTIRAAIRIGHRLDSAHADPICPGTLQREAPRHLVHQHRVASSALCRGNHCTRVVQHLELQTRVARPVSRLQRDVELPACGARERELIDVPRERDVLSRDRITSNKGRGDVLGAPVDGVEIPAVRTGVGDARVLCATDAHHIRARLRDLEPPGGMREQGGIGRFRPRNQREQVLPDSRDFELKLVRRLQERVELGVRGG